MDNIDIECPICLDIYGDSLSHEKSPKCLTCGDTICKICLQEIINSSKEDFFICPLCKERITKEENINKYIPNKLVISFVNSCFNVPKNENVFQNGENIIRYNVILLGDAAVGKTSIFMRLANNSFKENTLSSVHIDITTYLLKYKNQKYNLIIHDTSGQESFKALTRNYMRGKDGVLFIYDISDQKSFDSIESWYDLYKDENEEVVGLLIGNKCDKERKVDQQKVEEFSKKHELDYIETSAKLNKRIRRIIISLLDKIRKSKEKQKSEDKTGDESRRTCSYTSLNSADALSSVKTKKPKKKCC